MTWRLPFFEALGDAQRVLIAGAGGGFDVYAGLPLALSLMHEGRTGPWPRPRAAVLAGSGDPAGAQRLYRRALDGKRRTFGPEHPEVALTLNNLAALAVARGDRPVAVALAAEAQRILAPRVAADHPALASVTAFLAEA
ncbi:tetratricopeptide repeat protein [Dactylosporangium sp. NPDC050688]|uniref:tetratricopeptide repeat protein n=1 Tax=Dactylosporangium sp. NPDC050688 TaxID=3157217 RepID=UPI00340516EB